MNSTYDNLGVRTTEEILEKNIDDLQKQLTHANARVVSLAEKLGNIISIHKDLEYHLEGIDIYIGDIRRLIKERI